MKDIVPDDNILVVSLSRFEDLVKEQLPELKEENLLLVTYNRNTAPCLAYANYTILKRDPLAVTLVMPSDQIIGDHEEFNRILANAFSYAAGTNALITIGVVPTRPDTNFGYIQMMDTDVSKDHPVKVKTFTE
ncbi:MAG TPA: mannose-1-phosphate guanylyltransferase, partial [Rikenellaceae bacterium]|nr:mannose-1-phosphate guanylyltransferase [Rikenellaceae bacterium]